MAEQKPRADADGAKKRKDATDGYDLPMDKIEALLDSKSDPKTMTPQMRRVALRQQENAKRVQESIKGTKANPRWFVPLFSTLMIIGLVWCVVYYIDGSYPIPRIGAWNLAIGFSIIMVGFLMTMGWH